MQRNVRPMWFEPQNPSQLTVVQQVGADVISALPLSADRGVGAPGEGCVEEECTALSRIVTAHEHHHHESITTSSRGSMRDLSQQYRAAVSECVVQWRSRIYDSRHTEEQQQNDDTMQQESINLTQLTHVYITIHLSEIFLTLLSPPSWEDGDPFDKPGYVTADTVRFLRCHLVDAAENIEDDPAVLEEMVESEYPEQFQHGQLYWRFLEKLVLRGCLVRAWNLVKAHSLYRIVMSTDSDDTNDRAISNAFLDERQKLELANAFRAIKVILLRAPIPAGRTDDLDDALDNQTMMMMEDLDDDMDYGDDFDFDVTASDYKLWEVQDFSHAVAGDYPLLFAAEPAMRALQKWQDQVVYVRRTCSLLRRLPELDKVLAILLGDFKGISFDSWSEEFCAELLYRTPALRPCSMSPRASALMKKFASEHVMDEPILSIMDGEAGKAIDYMYINGGFSGAALPSTLVRSCS